MKATCLILVEKASYGNNGADHDFSGNAVMNMTKLLSLPVRRSVRTAALKLPASLALVSLLLAGTAGMAQAQSSASQLQQQIQSLRQEIADLQKVVYKGAPPPSTGGLSGASVDRNITGNLQAQIQNLEEQRRDLNGKLEDLDIRIRRIETRLDKLVSDVDFRLQALERGPGGQQLSGTTNGAQAYQPSQPAYNGEVSNGTTIITSQGTQVPSTAGLAPGQQAFGQISSDDLNAFEQGSLQASGGQPQVPSSAVQTRTNSAVAPAPSTVAPSAAVASVAPTTTQPAFGALQGNSPEEQYEYAYSFLPKHDFASAEAAFRAFLDRNGEHKLASNAMYWLGETYYARQQFEDAAAVFSDAYLRDRKASKATHSLLKLAMSLEKVGQVESSCVAYQELLAKHEDAEPRILVRAKSARKTLGCQ